jgi:NAD(P)-dependent dehydrogenase (short-subunit alcohol dehydrogenase family)
VYGCDVNEAGAAETARLVTEAGGTMLSLAPVDLSAADGARRWVSAAAEAFGGIDILYNNASAMRNTPFGEMPDEDWYFTITNELHVVYYPARQAWPYLVARGGGVILNMASISARYGATFPPSWSTAAGPSSLPSPSTTSTAATWRAGTWPNADTPASPC